MKLTSVIMISTLVVAACAHQVGPTHSAFLGDDPVLSGGSYTSGGGLTIAAELREKDGQTLVCGAWAQSRNQSVLTKGIAVADNVLATGSIFLGQEQVTKGLSFMQEVAPKADYASSEARCRLTTRPWTGNEHARDLIIRIPRQTVYKDIDGIGGGVMVEFKQTGPAAGSS